VNVDAATPIATPNSALDELRDRIASRVAQLKLVERRGIIGRVSDLSDTQITLTDVKNDTRFVDVDELTKFSSLIKSNESFGISDIKKGSTLGVFGLYNKQSKKILARSISEITLSKMIHGNIATIDSDNFILNVATDKNEQFQVSVETVTKTYLYDSKVKDLIRSGFSKIKEGQKIFIVGTLDKKDEKKISASRIIIFPDIVKASTLQIAPSPVISTGSGKKLTPIVK